MSERKIIIDATNVFAEKAKANRAQRRRKHTQTAVLSVLGLAAVGVIAHGVQESHEDSQLTDLERNTTLVQGGFIETGSTITFKKGTETYLLSGIHDNNPDNEPATILDHDVKITNFVEVIGDGGETYVLSTLQPRDFADNAKQTVNDFTQHAVALSFKDEQGVSLDKGQIHYLIGADQLLPEQTDSATIAQ